MIKSYYSLGLMSGTSMDGVDASIIQSDAETKYKVILDKYFEYPQPIYNDFTKFRGKIKSSKDLKKFSKELKNIEKIITLFHVKAVNQILKKSNIWDIGVYNKKEFFRSFKKLKSKKINNSFFVWQALNLNFLLN